MIALLVGTGFFGALAVSWYGYRTLNRIQRWGEKMNELDAIFQSVASPEEMGGYSTTAASLGDSKAAPLSAGAVAMSIPR